ncbi:winged helix-turn-helix transcriptional regulator [Bacillus mycoides]|jgi:DNA-binding HxlR family transcriptional regulator|uniref:winged helix-turn-helix transcriptional regulator n=1 Tax=Bacillus mycoides TaxID=1405 RepID=UPI00187A3791|nr:winged helix-turn-helix transcriptional regulator [Bacillus mycoides]MBE7128480.1 winged helix-turn-helix transcriptional regulator [Bacillus mycoides]
MKKENDNRIEVVSKVIGGKWKVYILYHLTRGPIRTGELKRLVTGITQKVLTEQLKELEKDGLISRKVYNQVPPKVEYSLTEHGESLKPVLKVLCDWGGEYIKHRYPNGEVIVKNSDDN